MLRIERFLKGCKFRPLNVFGEVVFGTQGETWEKKRLGEVMS